ncbi:zinc finger protein 407 isoform X1 [Phyllopteryx taeniolatus]|uniref:zinc finger protein 407 isoform X1 n=2 Tax=Phyllopteryx taeniolatus TaxID=161469 RepID=UPI002AD4FD17|nr:zinc finger protein 407 isoform X1 [Phyllopteryx taeniolatus]XP_061632941.1 zinc finger protein 407 isoform X1 [Phyllopteryx taeniolatus]XP_061632942.1 zinc finger protein 407 isoform X1 [Phyllopteryx taeniolatus]XP_061632943.1 zinc finger protein 407 isoform X1 [Phyllopteryx taeniolatus]XP_061632945.1 zinc finger protein 407 isoform X1 [Phyllopteryx taeniolatus]
MPKRGCPVVVHMDDVQAESPSRAMTPEKEDGGPTQRLQADTMTEDVSTRCSVCDFSAKCPRSLKIHYARKHKKSTNKAAEPPEDRQTISDDSTREVQKEIDMETECPAESNPGLGSDDPRSASLDNDGGNVAISDKQAKQEQGISSQERRVSKRTPKPKIIYSCNFCGLEFRDKSPLDVHIQRYHSKDSPRTVDADVYMDEEDSETTESAFKITPAQGEPKRTGSRLKLNCANCDFKVFTVSLLESHARVKHPGLDWYRCKLCNFFSATSEWMDKHLCSDTHKQHMSRHNSASHSSYVERVAKGDGGEDGIAGVAQEIKESMEAAKVVVDEEDLESEPPKPKRVRPKQASSTKCGYCGLVVSNATNLGVHVRRKHSKEYVYRCTLCCYSCVTKGDIDRHCITKKHRKRVQQCENSSPVKNLGGPLPQEPTDTQSQEPKEASFTRNMEQESQGSKKHSDEEQTLSYTCSVQGEYDSVACSHCNFIAHSVPSLDLHVKRKHTRDFEYVCLACRYYAVTTGEMSRHASTERHKQKSQKFQALQGNGGQKSLQSPAGLGEVIDLSGATVHVESEPLSLSDELELSSEESQKEKNQYTVAPSVPVEPVDAVGMLADKAKEKKPESIASSSGDAQDLTHFTVEQTAEAANMPQAELEVVQSSQQEIQEKDDKFIEGTSAEKSSDSVPRMSTARPFDTCIVSVKALPKQEQALLEGVALEGEVVVKGLTGEAPVPSGLLSHYVKKLKQKEVSVETKVRSTRIRCADCGFLADGLSGLNVHMSMKHPTKDKQFHCMVCGKSFYTESNLHQHLASSSHLRNEQNSLDERDDGRACFKCTKCTDRFETEQDLFIHIKEKHDELLKQVNKYVIEDTEQINREREEHQGNKCKYCGKVCKSSNSMAFLAHIRTHTGSKPFLCKICHFATAQLGDARNHVKRHLGMREYRCDVCGWAFVMKKHLSTHLLGKHGIGQRKERKFECKLCERSFSEKWALNNHLKLHSGEKPYKCSWPSCHYAFLNLSAMKDHYRTHTGEKSFLCDLCGFAGGTRHALTKHRRQHTGERPFKCKLCNFASTTQSHLSRHNRVHTGEKPYRCPWCDYRSNCAENIRKHILHTGKHEGVKMYNCPKCDYGTNSPIEFRNHLKDIHCDIENPDLAYLHAGIVSKSFECRLKGQGASFVETEVVDSSVDRKLSNEGDVQQVIIIQGYSDEEVAVDQTLEESAAATLQTLAMAGQMAEVLHITEDGQVIASGREVASAGAQLARGSTRYVVLSTGEAANELQATARGASEATGRSHIVSESSTALDALLSAVSKMDHQEKMLGEASATDEVAPPETAETVQSEARPLVKQEEEVQVINQTGQEDMQNLLQLAASRMIKEGLTQVIVNDEGTHYIVTELDNCTLQVEGGVYEVAAAGEQEAEGHHDDAP